MDSIIGDRIRGGRRIRPATQEYALEQFPRLIYALKTNRLKISSTRILNGVNIMTLWDINNKRDRWVILEPDFIICRDIAGQVIVPSFPADTRKMTLDKIAALVKLEFEGRGVPT